MLPRKRSLSDEGVVVKRVKREATPLTGDAFVTGIGNIDAQTSPGVFTQVSLPTTYSNPKNPASPGSYALKLTANFTAKDHIAPTGVAWTQGWMDMGGITSYEKILPNDFSLSHATIESRVMKSLAMGPLYTPKTFHNDDVTTKAAAKSMLSLMGRPAMQSYVEDITGRTSLNIHDVGSGMRAEMLAAKLKMRTRNKASVTGFKSTMLDSFPQLLTGTSLPEPGGAAHYASIIDDQIAKKKKSPVQKDLAGRVTTSHEKLDKAIGKRFDFKLKSIGEKTLTRKTAGKWWRENVPMGEKAAELKPKQMAKLRNAYYDNKYAKHDITRFSFKK